MPTPDQANAGAALEPVAYTEHIVAIVTSGHHASRSTTRQPSFALPRHSCERSFRRPNEHDSNGRGASPAEGGRPIVRFNKEGAP